MPFSSCLIFFHLKWRVKIHVAGECRMKRRDMLNVELSEWQMMNINLVPIIFV